VIHADVIRERARLTPDKTALVWVPDGSRYTYRDLDERAGRMVEAWFGAFGFAPGDRVGLLAHNRVEFIDAFFAAARSGVILVPLARGSPRARLSSSRRMPACAVSFMRECSRRLFAR